MPALRLCDGRVVTSRPATEIAPRVGRQEAGKHPEGCRLAATAGTEKRCEFAFSHRQVQSVKDLLAVNEVAVLEATSGRMQFLALAVILCSYNVLHAS